MGVRDVHGLRLWVWITHPLDWSLTHGFLAVTLYGLGAVAAVFLLLRRQRSWWLQALVVLVCSAAVTRAIVWYVDRVWRPFPDRLPLTVAMWLCAGIAALGLAGAQMVSASRRRRAGVGVAAVVAVLACAVGVNGFYGQYPAVRHAIGLPPRNTVGITAVTASMSTDTHGATLDTWRPPADMPTHGRVAEVTIPGVASRFQARPALVYVPPAHLVANRPRLPVLVLLAGQPGSPRDLFGGGLLDQALDTFARNHRGLAPIVVVPDDLGAPMANPLCVDSPLGNVDTYLSRDVPAWIRANLNADPNPARWAIGGYSHGGTCALQMGVGHPDTYPTFIDVAGQREPTLGDRDRTVAKVFGGNRAAFHRVNPVDILAAKRFPHSFAVIVAGDHDADYLPQQRVVRKACESAGMKVTWVELPGGHTWGVWGPGLVRGLDLIAGRLGLERS